MNNNIALLNDFILWLKEHDIYDIYETHDNGSEFYPTENSGDMLINEYLEQTTQRDIKELDLFKNKDDFKIM